MLTTDLITVKDFNLSPVAQMLTLWELDVFRKFQLSPAQNNKPAQSGVHILALLLFLNRI